MHVEANTRQAMKDATLAILSDGSVDAIRTALDATHGFSQHAQLAHGYAHGRGLGCCALDKLAEVLNEARQMLIECLLLAEQGRDSSEVRSSASVFLAVCLCRMDEIDAKLAIELKRLAAESLVVKMGMN